MHGSKVMSAECRIATNEAELTDIHFRLQESDEAIYF